MKEENRFYNYVYLDPEKPGKYLYNVGNENFKFDYEPFYVGKGCGNRIKVHNYRKTNTFMYSKMQSLKLKNIKPFTIKLNMLNEKDCYNFEIELIKHIGRRNLGLGPLVNLTDGGGGTKNYIVSEETKIKISKFNKGKKLSEEHIQKIVNSKTGIKRGVRTEQWKNNISKANLGKRKPPFTKEHIEKLRTCYKVTKAVEQYDIDDNFIKCYNSIKEASEQLNINRCQIGIVCRNIYGTRKAGGYKWKFKNK